MINGIPACGLIVPHEPHLFCPVNSIPTTGTGPVIFPQEQCYGIRSRVFVKVFGLEHVERAIPESRWLAVVPPEVPAGE